MIVLAELPNTTMGYFQLDHPVITMVEISAALAFSLMMVTCMCCYRKKQNKFKKHKGGSPENTYLDDLLSKPSLADPESVFSEAGSFECRFSSHARSFQSERNSPVNESVYLSIPSCDNKDLVTPNAATMLNHNTDQELPDV